MTPDDSQLSLVCSARLVDISALMVVSVSLIGVVTRILVMKKPPTPKTRKALQWIVGLVVAAGTIHIIGQVWFATTIMSKARQLWEVAQTEGRGVGHAEFAPIWHAVDDAVYLAFHGTEAVQVSPGVWDDPSTYRWLACVFLVGVLMWVSLLPYVWPLRFRGWAQACGGLLLAFATVVAAMFGAGQYQALSFAWRA